MTYDKQSPIKPMNSATCWIISASWSARSSPLSFAPPLWSSRRDEDQPGQAKTSEIRSSSSHRLVCHLLHLHMFLQRALCGERLGCKRCFGMPIVILKQSLLRENSCGSISAPVRPEPFGVVLGGWTFPTSGLSEFHRFPQSSR